MLAVGIGALTLLLLAPTSQHASTGPGTGAPALDGVGAVAPSYEITAGDGTEGNPYVTENQVIYVTDGIGIYITDSMDYHLYRNIKIIGSDLNQGYGIFCARASNVTVDGLVVTNLASPVTLSECERMRFRNVTAD